MAKYSIITATKPDGKTAVFAGKGITVFDAVEFVRGRRAEGYTEFKTKSGFPIYCPDCGALADVDPDPALEGFQKYCPTCKIRVENMVMYLNQLSKS